MIDALSKHHLGVYIFIHKQNKALRYCGASSDLVNDLINVFEFSTQNKDEKIHPIEKMIRISPFVDNWTVRIKLIQSKEEVKIEHIKNEPVSDTSDHEIKVKTEPIDSKLGSKLKIRCM